MEPKVSVIIPVYNVEKYLGECLDSVLGQTLKDIEVICVDDGSTDHSSEILQAYAEKDHRIKIVTQENGGLPCARNSGMRRATGKYLLFVDSDDYIHESTAQCAWEAAEKNQADIVVFGGITFPTVKFIDEKLTVRDIKYTDRSIDALMNERGSRPYTWNKMYRRDMIQNNGVEFCEDLRLGEDHAFQFDTFPLAKTIIYIRKRLYYYRQERSESIMGKLSGDPSKKLKGHVKLLSYMYDSWNSSGLMDTYGKVFLDWAIPYLYADTNACCYDATVEVAEAVCDWMKDRDASQLQEKVQQQLKQLRCVREVSALDPKVTVIVPVYNAGIYLQQCVESLLNQTLRNFQMIFVDDGSQDDSVEILQRYQQADRRITLLQQEHEFAGAARNRAMKHAKGKYLLFLDADDFFEPNLLEKSVAQIEKYDADICVFGSDSYDQKTKKYAPTPWTCKCELVPNEQTFNRKTESKNIFCFTTAVPWTKLYSRKFVEQHSLQYQCVRSANDLKFTFTALALAEKVVVLDERLVHYRVNTGTSLQQTQDKDPMPFYEALKALRDELKKYGVYQELEAPYKNYALDCCLYNLNTLKSRKNFEMLYFRLKNEILDELDLNRHDETYYYAYKVNRIFQKREDINQLGILEYVEKYGLFSGKQSECAHEVEALRKELREVRNSKSYRIGRLITAIPRVVRGGIRCLQENGIRYTIRRFSAKVKNRK